MEIIRRGWNIVNAVLRPRWRCFGFNDILKMLHIWDCAYTTDEEVGHSLDERC